MCDGRHSGFAPIAQTEPPGSCCSSVCVPLKLRKKKVARNVQPSIRIISTSIEMSSATSRCTFGCTFTHLLCGAGAPQTAPSAAAASMAERRCRPSRPSGSCTRAPGARRPHSKSFNWRPAASPKRAQRPRQPPSLYPLSHVLYDNVTARQSRDDREPFSHELRSIMFMNMQFHSPVSPQPDADRRPSRVSVHRGFEEIMNKSRAQSDFFLWIPVSWIPRVGVQERI